MSTTAFPSGVWGSQVETAEAVAPVLITRRELRTDSGGAGETRGGLGQRIELRTSQNEDFLVFLSVERVGTPASGRFGGMSGAPGRVRLREQGTDLPGKGEVRVSAGDTLIFETPGGGGFGEPKNRERQKIERDMEEELVSREDARAKYGYSP